VKYGYALLLALVALVAFTGFAAADRLPTEVPENQIFSIDTLIDVTGAVTDESEMQWTIDAQNLGVTTGTYTGAGAGFYAVPAWLYKALNKAGVPFTNKTDAATGTSYLVSVKVDDTMLTKIIDPVNAPGYTYAELLEDLANNGNYTVATGIDQGFIHNDVLHPTEEIAIVTWKDAIRTNGGKLSENKNIDFDSQNKGKGLNNLEATKVVTYASTEGAHLVGSELWNLDVAGDWENTADTIRCVFASAKSAVWPAFCNAVQAKSELVNVNSAQISTKGSVRAVAASGDVPAELSYQIAVTPDSNSGSGFAEGTVKTEFGGAIMEARGTSHIPSATNNWKDKTEVTGGIKNFQKTFAYQSGFRF
jgi:hypothetical protein